VAWIASVLRAYSGGAAPDSHRLPKLTRQASFVTQTGPTVKRAFFLEGTDSGATQSFFRTSRSEMVSSRPKLLIGISHQLWRRNRRAGFQPGFNQVETRILFTYPTHRFSSLAPLAETERVRGSLRLSEEHWVSTPAVSVRSAFPPPVPQINFV